MASASMASSIRLRCIIGPGMSKTRRRGLRQSDGSSRRGVPRSVSQDLACFALFLPRLTAPTRKGRIPGQAPSRRPRPRHRRLSHSQPASWAAGINERHAHGMRVRSLPKSGTEMKRVVESGKKRTCCLPCDFRCPAPPLQSPRLASSRTRRNPATRQRQWSQRPRLAQMRAGKTQWTRFSCTPPPSVHRCCVGVVRSCSTKPGD